MYTVLSMLTLSEGTSVKTLNAIVRRCAKLLRLEKPEPVSECPPTCDPHLPARGAGPAPWRPRALGPDAAHLVVAHDSPVVLRGVVPARATRVKAGQSTFYVALRVLDSRSVRSTVHVGEG